MAEPIDLRERHELCDLLARLGPDVPTLCEGWTAADLAAHLVLREHLLPSTASRLAAEKARGWTAQVARLRRGPPLIWRVPGLRTLANGTELFLHHEDVRRANGLGPRRATADLDRLAWRASRFLGARLARQIRPVGLDLVRPEGGRRSFGAGAAGRATLSGPPTELLLYLSGRGSAAGVALGGGPDAVAAVRRADLRL